MRRIVLLVVVAAVLASFTATASASPEPCIINCQSLSVESTSVE